MKRVNADVLIISVLAALTRLLNLTGEPLWYDESFTAWVARLPFGQLLAAVRGDVHPPSWYILEWGVTRILGYSESSLRLLSAIFGVVAVLLVIQLARAMQWSRAQMNTAGIIVALLPGALYYSTEARVYMLLACAVLLMLLGAIQRKWVIFGIAAAGCLYLHNFSIFYVAPLSGVALLFELKQRRGKRLIAGLVVVAIVWLPVVFEVVHQIGNTTEGFWIPPVTVGTFLQPFAILMLESRVHPFLSLFLVFTGFTLLAIALAVSRQWLRTREGRLMLATVFIPPALAVALSMIWRPLFLHRAFLASAILLAMIWGYGLIRLAAFNRTAFASVTAAMLLLNVYGHLYPYIPRSFARDLATTVRSNWQPGDQIFYMSNATVILYSYYLPGFDYALVTGANDLNQPLDDATKTAFGFKQADAPTGKRVWFISARNHNVSESELTAGDQLLADGVTLYGEDVTYVFLVDQLEAQKVWSKHQTNNATARTP